MPEMHTILSPRELILIQIDLLKLNVLSPGTSLSFREETHGTSLCFLVDAGKRKSDVIITSRDIRVADYEDDHITNITNINPHIQQYTAKELANVRRRLTFTIVAHILGGGI